MYQLTKTQENEEMVFIFSFISINVIQDESNYYEYNDFNQLIRVRGNNSQGAITEEYFYNGNNERLMKISYLGNNTNNTEYYFDESFVKRVNSTGIYNEEYVYHKETLIGQINQNGIKEFNHPDHLGSTSLTTNQTGSLIEETTYYPYGEIFEGGNNSRYTYTGKELDRSDLYYYGQRYYSPSILMRFTQADSLIQNIYNPQALNRYSYVLNNPYKYVDPDGRKIAEFGTYSGSVLYNFGVGIDLSIGYLDLSIKAAENRELKSSIKYALRSGENLVEPIINSGPILFSGAKSTYGYSSYEEAATLSFYSDPDEEIEAINRYYGPKKEEFELEKERLNTLIMRDQNSVNNGDNVINNPQLNSNSGSSLSYPSNSRIRISNYGSFREYSESKEGSKSYKRLEERITKSIEDARKRSKK